MKILIFSPLVAVWRPRLPTLLSVAQTHIDAGDEVVFVTCDRSVRACTANLDHKTGICNYCIAKKGRGLSLLEGAFREIHYEDGIDAQTAATLKGARDDLSSLDTLRALHYKNADVGYAAYSTYAYVARKAEPNLANPKVRDVIQQLVNTGKLVFEAASALIAAERPDRVVIHHGRGPMDRAALRAAQATGVDCWIYETAFTLNQLIHFDNALPHDIARFKERVDRQWETDDPDRERIGAAFFEMRRSGKRIIEADGKNLATQDRPFIKHQAHDAFPSDWDDMRKNIVIYGSSNDEFIAVSPEYEERIHSSQIEALSRLSDDLAQENVHLYFRVHPRQKGVKDAYIAALLELGHARANVTVIPADSSISSYALLDRADLVVAFLSTMAIEAAYWGKPSIIISASIYKPMGVSYTPSTHEELLTLLRSDLAPKDKTPCLKFGYYQMTSGFRQPYYQGDLGQGRRGYTFRGDPIRVGGLTRWRYFWSRERQRLKWRKII
jgi:hypothetical protein